jgi:hypothetical protein
MKLRIFLMFLMVGGWALDFGLRPMMSFALPDRK